MALRGVLTHRKTRRLARNLDIPACYALGILEALWHLAAEQCQNGDLSQLSFEDIADEIFYEGDPEGLIDALQKSGWLDEDMYVHDWHEHAPYWVHTQLVKRTELFANGVMPTIAHDAFNSDTRARIRSEYARKYPDLKEENGNGVGQVPDTAGTAAGQVRAIPTPYRRHSLDKDNGGDVRAQTDPAPPDDAFLPSKLPVALSSERNRAKWQEHLAIQSSQGGSVYTLRQVQALASAVRGVGLTEPQFFEFLESQIRQGKRVIRPQDVRPVIPLGKPPKETPTQTRNRLRRELTENQV